MKIKKVEIQLSLSAKELEWLKQACANKLKDYEKMSLSDGTKDEKIDFYAAFTAL